MLTSIPKVPVKKTNIVRISYNICNQIFKSVKIIVFTIKLTFTGRTLVKHDPNIFNNHQIEIWLHLALIHFRIQGK